MPTDHPDGTRPIVIVRADIKIPTDLQHQTINMKTNIAEAEINVPTNIVESVINVPTKIAESAINVPMKFVEQAVNIETDFKTQSVGVYAQPEWAASKGIDKNFEILETILEQGEYASINYTVDAEKTLYLTHYSVAIWGETGADRDLPQIVQARLAIGGPPWSYYGIAGGNGGVVQSFTKPVVVEGNKTFYMTIYNRTGHSVLVSGSCCGYEI